MKKLFLPLVLGLAVFSNSAYAQETGLTLPAHTFENQWEKPAELNNQVKWLVLSQSKDAGKMVRDVFEELKIEKPAENAMLYIADISAMPGFVTKLFAIPKMQDYAFPIALINEEGQISELKLSGFDTEKVTVLELDNLAVVKTTEFEDKSALLAKLSEVVK